MEDTNSLLIMVLHKIFHDNPKVVDDTYELIYRFNNGKKEKLEYEKVLKGICELMNNKLPSKILVYLLSLVNAPKKDLNAAQPPIVDKMQKTYPILATNVRPHLLEFLSCKKPDDDNVKKPPVEAAKDTKTNETKENLPKAIVKRRRRRRQHKSPSPPNQVKSLLDCTAEYVVNNQSNLKSMYQMKLKKCWEVLNSGRELDGKVLERYYKMMHFLNKRLLNLRCVESNNFPDHVLMEDFDKRCSEAVEEKDLSEEVDEVLRKYVAGRHKKE